MSASYYEDDLVTLLHGDALVMARTIGSGTVQTIVTSPPYFGLRDYGEVGQMGAEETVDGYVTGMVGLFSELRRTLAHDGTLWLNIGDSYGGNTSIGRNDAGRNFTGGGGNKQGSGNPGKQGSRIASGAPKNLIGVPWRVALALQADGWILRSDIIWAKPNPMPESVTDRPTKSHEYLFLLAKSPRYYYDADAIREQHAETSISRQASSRRNPSAPGKAAGAPGQSAQGGFSKGLRELNSKGANKRTVWQVPTVSFTEAHFATYPPELIRPCILAGSRIGDTVLDPFSGSGTTGMVATEEGRKYIGIDLNSDYLNLSLRTRFAQPVLNFGDIA